MHVESERIERMSRVRVQWTAGGCVIHKDHPTGLLLNPTRQWECRSLSMPRVTESGVTQTLSEAQTGLPRCLRCAEQHVALDAPAPSDRRHRRNLEPRPALGRRVAGPLRLATKGSSQAASMAARRAPLGGIVAARTYRMIVWATRSQSSFHQHPTGSTERSAQCRPAARPEESECPRFAGCSQRSTHRTAMSPARTPGSAIPAEVLRSEWADRADRCQARLRSGETRGLSVDTVNR